MQREGRPPPTVEAALKAGHARCGQFAWATVRRLGGVDRPNGGADASSPRGGARGTRSHWRQCHSDATQYIPFVFAHWMFISTC